MTYFFDARFNRHVIADDKEALKSWLRNTGVIPGDKQIYPTWLFRLSRPWTPREFPETGDEIIELLPPDMARKCLEPGLQSPFLFEIDTQTGTAFAHGAARGRAP